MERRFTDSIRPKNLRGSGKPEPVRRYCKRVKPLLPHMPTGVLVQWLYKHSNCALRQWPWLDFRHLRFSLEKWDLATVLKLRARDEGLIENYRTWLFAEVRPVDSELSKRMRQRGTWPRPVMVLDTTMAPDRFSVPRPLMLMEGHRRLGFLRGLADHGSAKTEHLVWMVTLAPAFSPA